MKTNIRLSVIASTLLLASVTSSPGQEARHEERLKWWDEARFGMFIHWGVYAVPAGVYQGREIELIGEWIMNKAHIPVAEYRKFAGQFNPVKYDPDAWVKLAKDAGMKYIIITSTAGRPPAHRGRQGCSGRPAACHCGGNQRRTFGPCSK